MNRSGAVVMALAAFLAVASAQVPSLGPCPDMSSMANFTINKVSMRARSQIALWVRALESINNAR